MALLSALGYLLPALILALALVLRRYPGERRLLALMRGSRLRRSRRARGAGPSKEGRPRAVLPRGGQLMGFSLAVRPPPAPAVVLHR